MAYQTACQAILMFAVSFRHPLTAMDIDFHVGRSRYIVGSVDDLRPTAFIGMVRATVVEYHPT